MPHDHLPPRIAAERAEPTGAYLVFFHNECDHSSACDHVERFIGRRPARSHDYAKHLTDFSRAMHEQGAAYFDEFGVAVLNRDQYGLDDERLASLRELSGVVSVRPEYTIYASGWLCRLLGFEKRADASVSAAPAPAAAPSDNELRQNEFTWGLDALNVGGNGYDGAGVKVAILDTGIDLSHPDFIGREIVAESFVVGETAQDGAGHGTHVAGTAVGAVSPDGVPRYGVAPGASLYVGKVLGDSGMGREGDMLAGILWALDQGCDIISMSLGRRAMPGDEAGDFDRIGQAALDRGSLIIAAAGNESSRSFGQIAPVSAPAVARSIMAVGAVDESLDIADFSNGGLMEDGGAIDIAGPGVDVLSAVPGGHSYFSGTSMATPHVSGAAALLAQSNDGFRGQALWNALTNSAKGLSLPARDVGSGLVQSPRNNGDVLV